jgi:hypothetical protein
MAAVLLTALGILRLGGLLGVPPAFVSAALFVVFSSQMFYAATAHISNDWLAVPAFTLLLAEAIALYRKPRLRIAARFGLMLGAALLTKAYFLAMLPLAVGLAVVCCRKRKLPVSHAAVAALLCLSIAAPWYARNLALQGNLSGMQETAGGTPARELLQAARQLPWLKTVWSTAHSALWTGNNSYMAFSALTLSIMLVLLAVSTALYARHAWRSGLGAGERIALTGIFLETLGLAYATVVAYWSSHGVASTPAPWYWQVLWPSAVLLLMLGLSRTGSAGRAVALALAWVWAYAIVATYAAKLIPFYAGLSDGRTRPADLPRWYAQLFSRSAGSLDTVALLPARVLVALAAAVALGALALAAILSRRLRRTEPSGATGV